MNYLLALAAVFCCGGVVAQSVTSVPVKVMSAGRVFEPRQTVDRFDEPLVDCPESFEAAWTEDFAIDGTLQASPWRKAKPISTFRTPVENKSLPYATEMRVLYSSTAIYVGGICHQPMDTLTAKWDQHDQSLWEDDNAEVFLNYRIKGSVCQLHVIVNALGYTADFLDGEKNFEVDGLAAKACRQKDGWSFEVKIPYSGMGIERRPYFGEAFGARFCRRVCKPKFSGAAPYLRKYGNTQRANYARLAFAIPEKGEADALAAERDRAITATAESAFARAHGRILNRLSEVEGATAAFKASEHPAYARAVQAVAQMRAAVDAYGKSGKSPADKREFIEMAAGFDEYVSQNGFLCWQVSPWGNGSPEDQPPLRPPVAQPVVFRQAGNEREAVCLAFTGLLSGSRLDLRVVPQPVRQKSGFISGDSFEVYWEPFMRLDRDVVTAPLVRVPGNIVTLTPGRVTRVWIVFNSRGVAPGTYESKILLKPAYDSSFIVKELPLTATVWNFTLPETRDWPIKSFFWGPCYFRNDESQAIKLMWKYHVTHGWTKSALYSFGCREDDVPNRAPKGCERDFDPELAWTANEEFFRTAKELGMRFTFGWGTPYKTPEWFQIMEKRLCGMGFDYEDFVFKTLIRDEFMKSDIPTRSKERDAVRKVSTNWWFQAVYLSSPPPSGATIEDIEAAKLPEFYRMWMLKHDLLQKPEGPEAARRLRAKGCQVWSYLCDLYMQRQNLLHYYRTYVWECRMMGLDGVAMWISGTRQGPDGFDMSDGYDDGICWYAGKEMVPTKRFEAFREGLEDVAYMDRLEKELARLGAAKYPQYQKLLDERAGIRSRLDQDEVDAWRLAVGEAIDKLTKTR